jgi:hypothetical protein
MRIGQMTLVAMGLAAAFALGSCTNPNGDGSATTEVVGTDAKAAEKTVTFALSGMV